MAPRSMLRPLLRALGCASRNFRTSSMPVRTVLIIFAFGATYFMFTNVDKPTQEKPFSKPGGTGGNNMLPLLSRLTMGNFHDAFMDKEAHVIPGESIPPWMAHISQSGAQLPVSRHKLISRRKVRGPMPWEQHIAETCEENGVAWNRDNFKPEMLKGIVVDDAHKIMYCPIPKVACTTWLRVMLALKGKIKMNDAFKIRAGEIHSKSRELNYLSQYSREEVESKLDTYFKFIIVRDPYERILSAYRNKFEEPVNLTGFHFVHGKPIVMKYRSRRTGIPFKKIPRLERYRPTFSEFVEYLGDSDRNIRMNNHWEKFHQICHPCIVGYNFVGNFASMDEDSKTILKASGLDKKITLPSRYDLGYRHRKTNTLVKDYFANVSEILMDYLYKEYRLDYEIFNMTYTDPHPQP